MDSLWCHFTTEKEPDDVVGSIEALAEDYHCFLLPCAHFVPVQLNSREHVTPDSFSIDPPN